MASEIVYINNGEVYKEQHYFSGAAFDPQDKFNYVVDMINRDPVIPVRKHKDGTVKLYTSTKEMRMWHRGNDTGEPLTGCDLCPDVTLWMARGVVDSENYDIYFRIDSTSQLQDIADYYSLPYPIASSMDYVLDDNESRKEVSMYCNLEGEYMVIGAVKFVDGAPSLLKFYTFMKDEDNRIISQKGRSLYNGGLVYEEGQLCLSHDPSDLMRKVVSNAIGGQSIKYRGKEGDPLFSWEAVITVNGETKVKSMESSKQYRTLIANLTTGDDFSTYDLCPDVNIWMAKSVCDNEIELYFFLEDSTMLEKVANYYSLPEPCDEATKARLDSDPEQFRFRHQDINKIGERSVPVVAASIVFTDDVATMFKLYEITRWNE